LDIYFIDTPVVKIVIEFEEFTFLWDKEDKVIKIEKNEMSNT
jgi:hypothetical protein